MQAFSCLFAILFPSLILQSCHNDSPQNVCVRTFLEEYDMEEYKGGAIPCGTTYLVLYREDNTEDATEFAVLHNDCADLLPQVLVDCFGYELCVYLTEEGCFEMVQHAVRIGIIGYQK